MRHVISREELRYLWGQYLAYAAVIVATLALALGTGYASSQHVLEGIGVAAVLLCGVLVLGEPVSLAVIAVIGVYVVQRIGSSSVAAGSSGGISYSDLLMAVAAAFALPSLLGQVELRRLKVPMIGLGVYLMLLLPTVVLNYATRGDLEWLHRLILVGGAMLVGAWLTQAHQTQLALRAFVWVSALVGVAAIIDGARHGFSVPAQPLTMDKNFCGALMSYALVIALCLGQRLESNRTARLLCWVALIGGVLASQSRGSMLAAAVAIAAVTLFTSHHRKTRLGVLVVAIGLAIGVFLSVRSQFDTTTQQLDNSSIGVRFNVEHETQRIWRSSPVYGVGLKYYTSGDFGPEAQAPNNVIDNELAESGVIGLIGFVALEGCVLFTGFRRRHDPFVAVGASLVLAILVHGMFDIYWSAGVTALPFAVFGMAIAAPPGSADVRGSR